MYDQELKGIINVDSLKFLIQEEMQHSIEEQKIAQNNATMGFE
ncbi:MAG: hypothetical protein R2831_09240 [Chitinophagaceae bacterium]